MILVDTWGPHERRREPREDWDENSNVIVVIGAEDSHRAWDCGDAPTREDYEAADDTLASDQERKMSMGNEAVIRFAWVGVALQHLADAEAPGGEGRHVGTDEPAVAVHFRR